MKLAMVNVWRRLVREGWLANRWAREAEAPTPALAPHPEPAQAFDPATSLFAFAEPAPQTAPAPPTQSSSRVQNDRERARLLLQIHDELLFETRREDADELAKIVVEEMTLGNPLSVPLKIDAEIGANWGEV